ncbi:MAG: hypothetical protein M3Y36_05420 [Actinomycetota bacterium]|nr:hypothetical protein [Actinomycetota bacterium]
MTGDGTDDDNAGSSGGDGGLSAGGGGPSGGRDESSGGGDEWSSDGEVSSESELSNEGNLSSEAGLLGGARTLLRRLSRPPSSLVTVVVYVDDEAVRAGLDELGAASSIVVALDREVEKRLASFAALSELTSRLALSYLERIRHAIASLTFESGVVLTTRGYLAHMVVEDDPVRFGADREVPVIGTLPDFRKGRPPQDLLSRVVKATRRGFEQIRAVPDDVWAGYVLCVTGHVHAGVDDAARLESSVVDSLVRFGWVLRQVDLRYGLTPG